MDETRRFSTYLETLNQTLTQEAEAADGRAQTALSAQRAAEQAIAVVRVDLEQRTAQLAEASVVRAALQARLVRGTPIRGAAVCRVCCSRS